MKLGEIVMTASVEDWLDEDEKAMFLSSSLERHSDGDWGDLDKEDIDSNNYAVDHGLRVLSAYIYPEDNTKIWIITEADRSVTTILFPEDY